MAMASHLSRRRGALVAARILPVLVLFVLCTPARPVASQQLRPALSLPGGPAGVEVTARMSGLPPGTAVYIGLGGLAAPHEILGSAVTAADGSFSLAVRVPGWVERNRTYFFFMAYADQRPRGLSDPFVVTGADGALRVEGTITTVEPDCALLQAHDETLYVLRGETGPVSVGARVVVDGTLTPQAADEEVSPCRPASSIAVRVRQVRAG